ncbi:MAG TPA: amino acid adenylation domain-containing protein, partial [Verrucomicrobiales bacterium]|nr:amino acid adenylation domain-containing protein [Verrucomicrobiales bacterium]
RMAHRDAGVSADSIGYVEAHGTGTPLGDPIEVTALTKAFRSADVTENQFCALGSLKTNIGHLDVASGVCGLIKTALSLEKAMLPPTLHFRKANPKIDFETSPFYVNASLTPWTEGRNGHPRRAGISAFGVGGTNAHVVLEEAPLVDSVPSGRPHQLFLLSGRSEEALKHAGENLRDFAIEAESTDPADAAWTLAIGRKPFRCRRAIAAPDLATLADAIASGSGVSGLAERFNPPVHFLFPGQGSQHVNMGRAFYEGEPRFRELVDRCSEILRPHLGFTLTDVLYPKNPEDLAAAAEQLKHTILAQPAIFVIEYAFADLWMSRGVKPTAMIGHSVGEFVAACHAGVFDLESGLILLATRGRLMGDLPSGGMLSVRMTEADLLARLPDTLDLAAINGPSLCVVAGPHGELKKFHAVLEAEEIVSQTLHTSHAFHSRMMDPVIERFAAAFEGITLSAPTIPILSTVNGEWLTEKETSDPHYWAKHLREPVRFHRAVRRLGEEHPEQIFVEVGPGQTLTGLARQTLNRKDKHLLVSTNRHIKEEGCDHQNFLESLGALWASGVEIDWEGFYSGEIRKRVILPTYPFERKRHWVEATPMHEAAESRPPLTNNLPFPEPTTAEPVMSTPVPLCRRETIAGAIRAILTDLSGIPEEELAGDASFLEQGFDSLLLTQVSRSLQNEFKTEITLRLLMGDLSSIEAMAKHLDATLSPDSYRLPAPEPLHLTVQAAPATITPLPSNPLSATVPTAAPSAHSSLPPMLPGSVLEGVIAQQLEVMRQQIALLQGSGAPVVAPALAYTPTLAPVPLQDKKSSAAAPATSPATTDVSAPTTAINRSFDDALTDRQQRHLHELIAKYTAKTHSSKTLTAKYRQWHADPRTVSGFNRNWKEMIYQISVKQSKGSRLLDVDGNEYIDLLNGFGPNFLGHSPDFVTEALHAQLDRGVEVGPQCVNAMEAAQIFCEITGNERASFVNTGSEAVQAAMRLARTVTGRDKIVVFTKDYHGNFDEVLVKGVGSGENLRSLPIAPGIPRRAVDDIIVLPYGTEEALDIIRTRAGELAAVIIEPVQSRRPEFQPHEFIREVREITRQSGTVFVFDEVITGFRTGPRGAQEFYGVEADIATYGKVVGGGMPLGVVAGKAEFMDTFDGGMWQYGDDSFPEKGVTFFAGTFVRHPLAMAAVKAVLLHLREKGPEFWETVKSRANRLAETVDRLFVENNVPIRMPNFGTQMFLRVAEDHKYANLFFFHLRNKGVFLLEGFPTYMTAAHTDADIDYCIAAFRESIAEMQEGGFFEVPAGIEVPHLNGSRLTGPPRQLDHVSPLSLPPANRSSLALPREPILYPMTESLAEIWLASQISENASRCFNEINTITLRGSLKIEALKTSLQDLVDRHDALRAAFSASGEGFRVRETMELPISQIDLDSLSAEDRTEAIEKVIGQERELIFDLESDLLFRASILKISADEHLLILNAHHLVCDGWSYTIVLEELGAIYRDRSTGLIPTLEPTDSFGVYSRENAAQNSDRESNSSETFWMEQYSAPVSALALPADFAAMEEPDFRCDMVTDHFTPAEVKAMKLAAGKSGASLFGLLMSAYQLMLHRVCRQQRFVVGFPAAGQNGTGHESLVGHCVNFLPFVAEVDPDSDFTAFLKKTQGRLLDALDHQDFTYGRLIQNFSSGERPVVEAVFNLEKVKNSLAMPGIESTVTEIERGYASNPLFLKVREYEEGLEIRFDYQSSLFSGETVRQWLRIFRGILEGIITAPGSSVRDLSSALSEEQLNQLKGWNLTKVEYPRDSSIHGLFSEVAALRGSKVALRFDGGEMSYEELDRASDGLARFLVDAGAVPGNRIGIFLDRSPLLITSILAVLKTGATYLPLDPAYPEERLQLMLQNSEVQFVITEETLKSRLHRETQSIVIDETSGASLRLDEVPDVSAESGAFILYTSGSTGTPKGSLGTHRNLVRLVKNVDYCQLNENETLLFSSSICFDASLFEIFGALLNGGTLVIPPAEKLSLEAISRSLTEHQVTTLWLTAGLFQIMIEECPEALSGLRQLITGGDVMTVNHASRLLEMHPHIHLINGYGPTENVTFSATHRVTKSDLTRTAIPIGRPVPNSTIWILDKDRKPVQPGVAAELFTGGDGVAIEYINDPVRTAEKFLPDPFSDDPHGRLYATGDLARFRHDGTIEFLGRIDH